MVSFSSGCELDLSSWGPNGRLYCHGLWPLSSPAISGGISRISFYFCREFIKVGEGCLPPSLAALGWLLFLFEHTGKRETLSPLKPGSGPLSCLCPGSVPQNCLPGHLPSLLLKRWREIQEQGDEKALDQSLHSLPKSQELKSFQLHPMHIFSLPDIPWWEQNLTGREEKGNYISKTKV